MDKDELNLEDLESIHVSPNNEFNFDKAIDNKELYRQKQIEELKELREQLKEPQKENTPRSQK